MLFPQLGPSVFLNLPVSYLIKTFEDVMDFINKRFGKWIVVSYEGKDAKSNDLYKCICDCGKDKVQRIHVLKSGDSAQCKSCYMSQLNAVENIIGKRFGNWLVAEKIKNEKRNEWLYRCSCRCGTIKDMPGNVLKSGRANKCPHCRVKTHGMSYTDTFNIWRGILSRCLNSKLKAFKWYGARGIKVCERWLKFENFLEDMGIRPPKLQIDRIDNDGNYEPSNCRWVTSKINNSNRKKPSDKKGN